MTLHFRDRDGVCVTYDVRGIPDSKDFPYVNDLATLKEAVAIGRRYLGIYGDGAATHIVRHYAKLLPVEHEFHHSSGMTHRWRVMPNGSLQLIRIYHRDWPTSRRSVGEYVSILKAMPYPANTVDGQLYDLAVVAGRLGLKEASRVIFDHLRKNRLASHGSSLDVA